MGQQQLLLIILGVIVVGIAVAVGITMFTDNAVSANRDAVTNDMVNLAARAQQFYRRPVAMGGGEGAFNTGGPGGSGLTSITQLTSKSSNSNGRYVLGTVAAATLTLTGIGKEIAGPAATDTVMVVMTVTPTSATVTSTK
jgi:Tfp pilus assembly protein PilE